MLLENIEFKRFHYFRLLLVDFNVNDDYTYFFFCIHSYSSGGEDGYVRVHYFDPSYFDFRFEFWSRSELSDYI